MDSPKKQSNKVKNNNTTLLQITIPTSFNIFPTIATRHDLIHATPAILTADPSKRTQQS